MKSTAIHLNEVVNPHPILIGGNWRPARSSQSFQAENPLTGQRLPDVYPVSTWEDCDAALVHATMAAALLREMDVDRFARFLERYADLIEAAKDEITLQANLETALPVTPRLAEVELPRTTNQLRQAAAAAREGSWSSPTIDTKNNLRSYLAPIGPVCVLGPNNFPLAYNSIAGGDFAAAIATGNPVIAKAHPNHPSTTRLLAEYAQRAAAEIALPPGTVQLLYAMAPADGERLVADRRMGAVAFTGSRIGGLKLKAAADRAGVPIYVEMSSLNPVIILPGVLQERSAALADEFTKSCLMAVGQFCTNPGLVVLLAGESTETFVAAVAERFRAAPVGRLLSAGVLAGLTKSVDKLRLAGAELITGGTRADGAGYGFANTLLRATGKQFLAAAEVFQTEAFGNATLFIIAADVAAVCRIVDELEGNLTGSIWSASDGSDDEAYEIISRRLRPHVGRLLNDKMPTGVVVSPAMQHGGPYPATGHPGFTAVGIPASMRRFAMLQCFDSVRPRRLPNPLRDANPNSKMWRNIDGTWTRANVTPA